MNLKLLTLIIIIGLSIILFLFISYAEWNEGINTLLNGVNGGGASLGKNLILSATKDTLTEGITEAMKTIDKIVQ